MPRVVCISDTHGLHESVTLPDGDVLVHAGDFMNYGRDPMEAVEFFGWFGAQKHPHKVLIAGNHDVYFEQYADVARRLLPEGVEYLEDSGATVAGLKFWGTPVTPEFGIGWAFNRERGFAIRQHWRMIPTGTDVVITHGPPNGILDEVGREHVGCEELRQRLDDVCPRLTVFGHIHSGYGRRDIGDLTFINASVCNERYRPVNEPQVVDIEPLEELSTFEECGAVHSL